MRYLSQRDELLVAGLVEPISLAWLHDHFEYDCLDRAMAQQSALEMIRQLVGDGLFVVGTPASVGSHQWLMPLDEVMDEITGAYVGHFADRDRWAESIALYQTAKGKELGRALDRQRW